MSIGVEYSEEPSSTSGGRYHSVTTSLEYVLVGTDLALARPVEQKREMWTQIGHLGEKLQMTCLVPKWQIFIRFEIWKQYRWNMLASAWTVKSPLSSKWHKIILILHRLITDANTVCSFYQSLPVWVLPFRWWADSGASGLCGELSVCDSSPILAGSGTEKSKEKIQSRVSICSLSIFLI